MIYLALFEEIIPTEFASIDRLKKPVARTWFLALTAGVVLFKKYGIEVKVVTSDDPVAFAAIID